MTEWFPLYGCLSILVTVRDFLQDDLSPVAREVLQEQIDTLFEVPEIREILDQFWREYAR